MAATLASAGSSSADGATQPLAANANERDTTIDTCEFRNALMMQHSFWQDRRG
jgi:hypothetical protein